MTGGLGWVVCWAKKALFGIESWAQFLLLPDVIPTGDRVDPKIKELVHQRNREAEAIGGVLTIGDDDIGSTLLHKRVKP